MYIKSFFAGIRKRVMNRYIYKGLLPGITPPPPHTHTYIPLLFFKTAFCRKKPLAGSFRIPMTRLDFDMHSRSCQVMISEVGL